MRKHERRSIAASQVKGELKMRDYVGEALRGAGAEDRWKGAANGAEGFDSFGSTEGRRSEWPEPKPLPKGLPAVAAFDSDFLPDSIVPWVMDINNRMQCQPDNVAVAAMTALGAVIGRRVGIKPQMNTDWVEVPNIWVATIGRPGLIKSGAQNAGVGPLHHWKRKPRKRTQPPCRRMKPSWKTSNFASRSTSSSKRTS
jgi:hypothetical protein